MGSARALLGFDYNCKINTIYIDLYSNCSWLRCPPSVLLSRCPVTSLLTVTAAAGVTEGGPLLAVAGVPHVQGEVSLVGWGQGG